MLYILYLFGMFFLRYGYQTCVVYLNVALITNEMYYYSQSRAC
jgi:hypothetical protein